MLSRSKKRWSPYPLILFVAAIFLLLLVAPCISPAGEAEAASEYNYTILKESCDLQMDPNGGAHIEYLITINNQGKFLQGLDIRMPNLRYDLDTAQAQISGNMLSSSNVKQSSKYDNGVYLDFGVYPIPSNGVGTVWLKIWAPVIALEDDKYEDYSKIRFTPAWFPEEDNTMTNELVFTIHLPPGIPNNDIFPLGEKFTTQESDTQGTIVRWEYEDITWSKSSSRPDMGVRVPSKYVEAKSEFWEITIYEYLEFFSPLNVLILLGIVIVIIVLAILLNKMIGKRTPYKSPTFTVEATKVDHSLDPVTFAYLDGKRPKRVLAILLLLSLRDGVVKIGPKEPLTLQQEWGKGSVKNNPYLKLLDGQLEVGRVKIFFRELDQSLGSKAKSYDLNETKSYYERRVEHAWKRLNATKHPLDEIRVMDQEIGWMAQEKYMKKKWGKHISTRDEVTIPEWLFLLLYNEPDYKAWTVQADIKDDDQGYLQFLKRSARPFFNTSGVTVDGEDTDENLIETIYDFEQFIESKKDVKRYLATVKRYKPKDVTKKPNIKTLPEENKGTYIKYGGGV